MKAEPVISGIFGALARGVFGVAVGAVATSVLYSQLRKKGFQIEQRPEDLGTFRPDLIMTSRDGERFIVESKRNVFADDVARMSVMAILNARKFFFVYFQLILILNLKECF